MDAMRTATFPAVFLILGLCGGCATQSGTQSVEVLDQATGMTVASLKEPIELLPGVQNVPLARGKRATFAYLGPVEWDSMGTITYGLWVHIAPGNDRQAADIHAPSALTLNLDDGPLELAPMDAPKLGREPYHALVSWGQSGYFNLPVQALRRMAASSKLVLAVRATDGSVIDFSPTQDSRAVLTRYARGRGITGD
jgi:hypothetical protein